MVVAGVDAASDAVFIGASTNTNRCSNRTSRNTTSVVRTILEKRKALGVRLGVGAVDIGSTTIVILAVVVVIKCVVVTRVVVVEVVLIARLTIGAVAHIATLRVVAVVPVEKIRAIQSTAHIHGESMSSSRCNRNRSRSVAAVMTRLAMWCAGGEVKIAECFGP